MTNFIFIVHLG